MVIHGVRLKNTDDMVVKSFIDNGGFEDESISEWRQAIKPGFWALDVGAYSGLYAIISANMGANSQAWECNPHMIKRLRHNVRLNSADVDVIPCAAGSGSYTGKMLIKWDHTSAGRVGDEGVDVQVRPIERPGPVCAVKIDVEGGELDVLSGMTEILKTDKPLVIAEALNPEMEAGIASFMAGYGYTYRMADKRNMVLKCV